LEPRLTFVDDDDDLSNCSVIQEETANLTEQNLINLKKEKENEQYAN